MRPRLTILYLVLILSGCAQPVSYNEKMTTVYDKDTEYRIDETPDGFEISVKYNRYQFIPESSAVATACKSQLTAIAWEYADKRHKEILPINEQRIQISMGRNGLTGITSCEARVASKWK